MRDRLIELIKHDNCISPATCSSKCKYVDLDDCHSERLADHLLANGVIVPPCKVGDVVYVIEPCACYNKYSEFDKCHRRRTKATRWLKMVRVPSKHHTKCLKLFERPFRIEYLNKIGKTVFLTREEAEAKLKEGAE